MRIKVYRRRRPVLMMGKERRCIRRVSMMGNARNLAESVYVLQYDW